MKQEPTPIIQRDKNPSQNSLFAKVDDKKQVPSQQDVLGKRQIFAEQQKVKYIQKYHSVSNKYLFFIVFVAFYSRNED